MCRYANVQMDYLVFRRHKVLCLYEGIIVETRYFASPACKATKKADDHHNHQPHNIIYLEIRQSSTVFRCRYFSFFKLIIC